MNSSLVTFALAGPAQADFRFGCSNLSVQRLDQEVEPSKIPLQHVHQIVGGNAFAANMKSDIGAQASYTTCIFLRGLL
ncbi:hypothetical protein DL769_002116 [Monosporascus sp. CRB-8-3]|nr:hypothetical protein DL769_002116 [Monosporascus sp. CRB-8-3]